VNRVAALSQAWLEAKAREADAVEQRRAIEDALSKALEIDAQQERQTTAKVDGYSVKVICRLSHKIDSDKLQEVAAQHGLTEHLSGLFRWKPELNLKAWKAATPDITQPLEAAITTTAGRPSFSITKEEVSNG
jgi:hypothetical protein